MPPPLPLPLHLSRRSLPCPPPPPVMWFLPAMLAAQAPKKGPKEYDEDDKAFLEKKKVGAGDRGAWHGRDPA